MNDDIIIRLNDLSKFIQEKPIVLRMNAEIPRGSMFGLLGPNGAGKTTTLKLLTGRLKPTSGSASVLGLNPWKDRVKLFKKIGYLPQNPSLHRDKTVIQFLKYMSKLKGYSGLDATKEAREKLDQLGLSRFELATVGKLSGGETQRLGFANSLLGDPELILMDEPTASLDPEGRIYVMNMISDLSRDRNQTFIISSHILPEIQRMTTDLAIMSQGRILVSGKMRELTKDIYDDVFEIETSHPLELKEDLELLGYDVEIDYGTLTVNTNGNISQLWFDLPSLCKEKGYQLRTFKPIHDALENLFLKLVSNQAVEDIQDRERMLDVNPVREGI